MLHPLQMLLITIQPTFFKIFFAGIIQQLKLIWILLKRHKSSSKMTAAENVCYTLINVTSDSEPPSEVSLKTDLGMFLSQH